MGRKQVENIVSILYTLFLSGLFRESYLLCIFFFFMSMYHFYNKSSKAKKNLNNVLLHYIEWGLDFSVLSFRFD